MIGIYKFSQYKIKASMVQLMVLYLSVPILRCACCGGIWCIGGSRFVLRFAILIPDVGHREEKGEEERRIYDLTFPGWA